VKVKERTKTSSPGSRRSSTLVHTQLSVGTHKGLNPEGRGEMEVDQSKD
jgi:hypothetical protein